MFPIGAYKICWEKTPAENIETSPLKDLRNGLSWLKVVLFVPDKRSRDQSLISCSGGRRQADGLRQQHVRTIRLLVWDTLEDFTTILTYTWDETKDDSACCTYVRGRFNEE
jgi:hypothetical protein